MCVCFFAERPRRPQEHRWLSGLQYYGYGIEGCMGGSHTYGLLQGWVLNQRWAHFLCVTVWLWCNKADSYYIISLDDTAYTNVQLDVILQEGRWSIWWIKGCRLASPRLRCCRSSVTPVMLFLAFTSARRPSSTETLRWHILAFVLCAMLRCTTETGTDSPSCINAGGKTQTVEHHAGWWCFRRIVIDVFVWAEAAF